MNDVVAVNDEESFPFLQSNPGAEIIPIQVRNSEEKFDVAYSEVQ